MGLVTPTNYQGSSSNPIIMSSLPLWDIVPKSEVIGTLIIVLVIVITMIVLEFIK